MSRLTPPSPPDPPQKIWLKAPAQDVPLHMGTVVRLICFATGGNPAATLTWYKVDVVCECVCFTTWTHTDTSV